MAGRGMEMRLVGSKRKVHRRRPGLMARRACRALKIDEHDAEQLFDGLLRAIRAGVLDRMAVQIEASLLAGPVGHEAGAWQRTVV